jgi:hypothetical protein
MEGSVGVAHGAGGGSASAATSPGGAATSVECPSCGRENGTKNKHCIGCGERLRA